MGKKKEEDSEEEGSDHDEDAEMQVLAQMADENDFDDQCEENINAGLGADGG
jgi:hypothetical protein